MTYTSSVRAAGSQVWVALGDTGGVYAEAAEALRAETDRSAGARVEWRIAPYAQFRAADPAPRAAVAIGSSALRGLLDLYPEGPPFPVLALLVPRLAYERMHEGANRGGMLSAIYLDQPPARQIELIRQVLPGVRRIGALTGADSRLAVPGLERATSERGIQFLHAQVGDAGLFPALQQLLGESDVLLALADTSVFNSQTVAGILTAAYRRQIPLIGFSPAYVKAGALAAVYSTPAQIGLRGGELLRLVLTGQRLPPPQWPREFSVSVNSNVARSFGLTLDEGRLTEQLRQKERGQ